jgi:predicted nucleotidyltransferase component of viral defense system
MGSIDYKTLYDLQDRVLDTVFKTEQVFYLTGGTCLNRFYYEKRYSDDLDFFTHNDRDFNRGFRSLRKVLKDNFSTVQEEVTSRDFIRIKIDGSLQVDFVNDRVERYGELVYLDNGYIIDNCKNIFVNKITAVIGRDNPKDIFDLYLLDKFNNFDFKELLEVAHKKAGFSNDDFIIRLKTFPLSLLDNIVLKDISFLDDFKNQYFKLIEKFEKSL